MQRTVLWARAEGQPVNEIARSLSISAKAVESLISRARASLRVAMSGGFAAVFGVARRLRSPFGVAAAAATAGVCALAVSLPVFRAPADDTRGMSTPSRSGIALTVADTSSAGDDDGRGDGGSSDDPGHGKGQGDEHRHDHSPPPADEDDDGQNGEVGGEDEPVHIWFDRDPPPADDPPGQELRDCVEAGYEVTVYWVGDGPVPGTHGDCDDEPGGDPVTVTTEQR